MAKKPIIGLLGGGQLGMMLCEQASPLGIEVLVLDAADCPAKKINQNSKHVTGSFKDPVKVRELAAKCDVLTVEIEHINTEVLEEIATKGVLVSPGKWKKVPVHPSWETLRLIQDKFAQKDHFAKAGLPIAPQMAIESGEAMLDSMRAAFEKFGVPFMLKSRKDSYDGRGNFTVRGTEDFEDAVKSMGGRELYAEKFVNFRMELSVMVVRTEDSQGNLTGIHPYPAVETIHEDSICTKVYYPPRKIASAICEKARKVAGGVVSTLKGRGVFAVEMFVVGDGDIVINETAPRPHNSGHLTIEAVPYMSQYKAQIYSVLDILPRSIKLEPRVSSAIMLNILGGASRTSHESLVQLSETLYDEKMDIYLHLYGKESKPGRKIGHITVTTSFKDSELEQLALPLQKEVDRIRMDRLKPSSVHLGSNEVTAEGKKTSSRNPEAPLVVVTMGSDSDLRVLSGAFRVLEDFGVPYDYTITSAHRTPARMVELGKSAAAKGIKVLIAGAGGAAHLPGMLASETPVPVIGVPVKATHLDGHDSLLSIVQMPRGCPVATVGINNSTNAGLLAVKILGSFDSAYREKMENFMKNMEAEVIGKAQKLEEIGYEQYLAMKK